MTRKTFVDILAPLALARRREMDAAQWRLLHAALDDVPEPLLRAAVVRASRTRKWFPNECEIREDAEACRLEIRALQRYESCDSCVGGWTEIEIDGITRVTRCPCWKAYQAKLRELGGTSEPLALPPAEERFDSRE